MKHFIHEKISCFNSSGYFIDSNDYFTWDFFLLDTFFSETSLIFFYVVSEVNFFFPLSPYYLHR